MIDMTSKQISLRTAHARTILICREETMVMIKNNTLPKGNLFDIAKAAGLLGAKKTPELIPHCHPIALDYLDIRYKTLTAEEIKQIEPDYNKNKPGIEIIVTGKVISKTGLEMEVLTSATITALTIYDLLKPVDKEVEIINTKLLEKTGGKSDAKSQLRKGVTAAVLVCSDSTAAGKREDNSGIIIQEMLKKFDVEIKEYKIIPDETQQIQEQVKKWVDEDVQFIFTSGGTGLGPRDNTVDAVKAICEKDAPGIAEAMRAYGTQRTAWAMHSRSYAGSLGKTLIVCMPGSSNGAKESLEAILPGVFHARKMLKGGGH
ncbi:MAG: bifunctional molybdenum cofactor biosynthesis protein MoaC/MoaB [Spirochaetia bacterium]|nr:bifunctional molybdenum cofactor biosynthesis protein MoaC/MoaB [Spirochaetia bacterium]